MTRELALEAATFEAILSEAGDAVVICDRDGVIRFWNRGAERIFGHGAAAALGRPLDIIVPENLRQRHNEGFAATVATGRSKYGAGDLLAVPALRADGTRISIEFSIVLLRDPAGAVEGVAAIIRDVTRQFELVRTLKKQAAAR